MENIRKKIREHLTTEDLAVWFGTKKKPKGSKQPKGPWVNICSKKDGRHPPCGRDKATDKSYPKCRAAGVASKMTDDEKRAACSQKRRVEKTHDKSGKGNKPAMASYKPKKESVKKTITLKESELISLIEKIIKEETGSSSDGSYETPGFLAKNIPNMRQGAKTTYGGPGGKFVKIKSKCRKFPYCSQGAVDSPLELSDKYKGESTLSGEMELTPTYPKSYKGNTQLTKTKWVNEEAIPGGKSSGMGIKEIAKKHKVSPQLAMKEWLKGVGVEMEHTTDKKIAREIAKDHLYEDIYYYKKLSKIE